MEFLRTFHSVGQGAFYSEEILDDNEKYIFRMIYDCGSSTLCNKLQPNKRLKNKVLSDLGNDTNVDLLIISHFDMDHINGVDCLNPKRVMIPFYSEDAQLYLYVQSKLEGSEFHLAMLRHPEEFFRGCQIIRVMPNSDDYPDNDALRNLTIDINDDVFRPAEIKIASNSEIHLLSHGEIIWEYIACNPYMEMFADDFKNNIKNNGLDWNSLENTEYFNANIEKIRSIYDQLGNKNQHSLVVYSGAYRSVDTCIHLELSRMYYGHNRCFGYPPYHCHMYCGRPYFKILGAKILGSADCIYFGDATIDENWLIKFYSVLESNSRLYTVSVMQVPHHGSWRSRGHRILKDSHGRYFFGDGVCMISHGETNFYGHPSARLVNTMLKHCAQVVSVTELASSQISVIYEF